MQCPFPTANNIVKNFHFEFQAKILGKYCWFDFGGVETFQLIGPDLAVALSVGDFMAMHIWIW